MAMKIRWSILLLFVAFAAPNMAAADEESSPEKERQEQQDQVRKKESTEDACDCCMKCQAARREIPGKESPRGEGNGCADCCDRCGTTQLPLDHTAPPGLKKKR